MVDSIYILDYHLHKMTLFANGILTEFLMLLLEMSDYINEYPKDVLINLQSRNIFEYWDTPD